MKKFRTIWKKAAALCIAAGLLIPSVPINAEPITATSGDAYSGMMILQNVTIDGVDVGGMTYEAALDRIHTLSDEYGAADITLVCSAGNVNATLADIGYRDDGDEVVLKAAGIGNSGDILKRYKERKTVETEKIELHINKSVDASSLDDIVESQIGDKINGTGSGVTFIKESKEKVSVIPEDTGMCVDTVKTVNAIDEIMASGWTGNAISTDLIIDESGVSERVRQLSEITDLLGEYTTNYSSASGRMKNVQRATDLINGSIIYPGEQFSASQAMGPRTSANGYYTAGQYVGGKHVDGVGGGVCQVSTTLYNAVIRAELQVTQRNNHGLTVSYVPLSSDAAIAGDVLDLKFVNNTDSPIYIEGTYADGNVTFRIYGKEYRPANRKIEFVSKTISVISPGADVVEEDPSLPPGKRKVTQKAHTGYVAELWKNIYIDGVLTESVQVNKSSYRATPNYVSVGPEEDTEEPATEAPPAEAPATEAPPTETPATEAPPTETPATEAPPAETPATEAPSAETPAEDPASSGGQ